MSHPIRHPALLLALALSFFTLAFSSAADAQDRPNVVLIVGDDYGWPEHGFLGDVVARTPHLDALAAGGTVFRNAHVTSSVCMPSMRALLAGIHSVRWDAERDAIEREHGAIPYRRESAHFRTLPRELARLGYVSWEGGKMWEGTYRDAGFTYGLATEIGTLFTSIGEDFGRTGWAEGTALDPLRAFLDEAGERPFFVWFAPMLPHAPFDAPGAFRTPFAGLGLPPTHLDFYANAAWFDALVGELVAELDERGLRENTLLVYLADNGWDIIYSFPAGVRGKGTLGELGFRTPLVFNWPGRVPAAVVRDDLVSSLDVMPTILEFAGGEPLPDREGRSLVEGISTGSDVGRDAIVTRHRGVGAANRGHVVRTPAWRYVGSEDGTERLYAIDVDPFENVDLAASRPDLLPGFRAQVVAWEAALDDAPERLDVTGELRDAEHAPISGAEVELRGRPDAGGSLKLRVLTGADGAFRFAHLPHGRYEVRAVRRARRATLGRQQRRVAARVPVGALGSHLPLVASPGAPLQHESDATLRGSVRDEHGAPLALAQVVLRGRSGAASIAATVVTAEDGTYRLENLPPGAYRAFAVAGRTHLSPRASMEVGPSATATLDLVAPAR